MVIAFSTIPGYVSNRDREKGTWFIQSIYKVSIRGQHLGDNITNSMLKQNVFFLFKTSLYLKSRNKMWRNFAKHGQILSRLLFDCLSIYIYKVALSTNASYSCYISLYILHGDLFPPAGHDNIVTSVLWLAGVQRESLLHLAAGHAGPGGARPEEQPPEWDGSQAELQLWCEYPLSSIHYPLPTIQAV